LIASDNMSYSSSITPEGAYSIPNVPGGPVKLCVTSPNPDAGRKSGGPAPKGGVGDAGGGSGGGAAPPAPPLLPKGAWVQIPAKYADPNTSGLTGTVNRDTTIDLKVD